MEHDAVDKLLNQWELECPYLNTEGLGIVVRVQNLHKHFKTEADKALLPLELELWEYDVMSVLRRQGRPYEMLPTELADATWLSAGAMTNRLDKLEAKGFIARETAEQDRRSVTVRLTPRGRRVTNKALQHRLDIANENINVLNETERHSLFSLLKKISQAA